MAGPSPVPTSTALGASPPESTSSRARVCPTCSARYPEDFRVCPRDATELARVDTSADADADPIVGSTLADTYAIVRTIGEGGMGRVYEARHTRIGGRRFAIKRMLPEFAKNAELVARFQREAEAAARIRSPHVVEVYDVSRTADGCPFLVAELLEGRELGAYLDEVGKLSVPLAVRIARQICRGLAAAHDLGIVHRDMKPENVFLVGDLAAPTAKILDFGISKVDERDGAHLTQTGMILGTPSFMAPEQARGEPVTLLADVYAVGAILYTMLTGARPFDRADATSTLSAVLLEEPPRPRSLEPSIPDGLEAAVQQAMSKRQAGRPIDLRALEASIAPWDAGGASSSAGTTAGPRETGHELDVRDARRAFVGLAILAASFVVLATSTWIGALVRLARGGDALGNLTGWESVVVLAFVAVALATPSYLAFAKVRATIWDNTARVYAFVLRTRWAVLAAYASYALGELTVRFVETIVLRRAVGAAWPAWDALLPLIALGAGAIVARRTARLG